MAWQHTNSDFSARVGRDSLLFEANPRVGETYEADLGGRLYARIPLALWADSLITFPEGQVDSLTAKMDRVLNNVEDARQSRGLAAIIKFWNKREHFFPYFDDVDVNWSVELDDALAQGLNAVSSAGHLNNIHLMMAALPDGHAISMYSSTIRNRVVLPVRFEWIEGHLAVTTSDTLAVSVGDVIVAIEGMNVNDWYHQLEKRISGSPQWKRMRAASGLFYGRPEALYVTSGVADSLSLALKRADDSRYELFLRRHLRTTERYYHRGGDPIRTLDEGIYYVDLTRADWESIDDELNEIASASGVVFDVRGYTNNSGRRILSHLLERPDSTNWMLGTLVTRPHMKDVSWNANSWNLQPADPHISGQVVFLTDARAISYAESVLGYVHGGKLGTIVGTETAGASGGATQSEFGEWAVRSTISKIVRHDGEQLFGLGFPPDIRAEPTLKGLRAGRDDVLEAGLSVLKAEIKASKME